MIELREPEAIEVWLATGWPLARVPAVAGSQVATWFATVMAERPGLPPPGCVVDLATLATEGCYTRLGGPAPDDPDLRRALRGWEDQVLGRLVGDPRLTAVQDAVLALPPALRAEASGLFASVILGRLGAAMPGGAEVAVVPGVLRRALETPVGRSPTEGALETLTRGYERLVQSARGVPELLGPGDVFLLTWMERLRSLEARVALEQIAGVAAGTELPRRVRSRRRKGTALSRIEEESAYPVGGFSSISTSGAIENLVTSELAYMSVEGDGELDVDLFDLRWAEGELLYYSRDEGAHHRERRAILVLLDPALEQERAATGGLQRIVVVLGRLVAVLRRVVELLGEAELHVRISAAPGESVGLELDLLELLLRDLVQRQVLTVDREPVEVANAWLASQAGLGTADCLVVQPAAGGLSWAPSGRALSRMKPTSVSVHTDPVELLRGLI